MQMHTLSGICSFFYHKNRLSNAVCLSRYLEYISHVNSKGPDLGESGKVNSGAHMSGICIFIVLEVCSFKYSLFQSVPSRLVQEH